MTFCEHYIPNNPDFNLAGCCIFNKQIKKCPYRGEFPELSVKLTMIKQKDCSNYEEWQDPLLMVVK